LLSIAAAVAVLIWIFIKFKLLVVPLLVAILITALVWPFFAWLRRWGLPKPVATILTLLGTLAVVFSLGWLVSWQVAEHWGELLSRAKTATEQVRQFLLDGPLHLSAAQIDQYLADGMAILQEQAEVLISGVLAVGSSLGRFGAGILLAVFAMLCFLSDGSRIWAWSVRLFPRRARKTINHAGRNGWQTLINYTKTQIIVASIDSVGIGFGAFFLGVPMAIPIAASVFVGSFVPVLGAVLTGGLAVLIALLYEGAWVAAAMLAIVLIVQQLEGHVLQPFLMGTAVNIHPLAVIMAVAGGAMVAGIPGALFAVPTAAFINVAALTIAEGKGPTNRKALESTRNPEPNE